MGNSSACRHRTVFQGVSTFPPARLEAERETKREGRGKGGEMKKKKMVFILT